MKADIRVQKNKQKGTVLILALVFSLLMLIMATGLIGLAYFSSQQAYFYQDYAQALYAAEAGLNRLVADTTGSASLFVHSTVGSANCQFTAYTYTVGTITYAISTGEVTRLRTIHRIIQVKIIPGDSPWNHMIWQGGSDVPAGSDPSTYPSGYNSTTNGPKFGQNYIPKYILDAENHWVPYYSIATSSGNLFLSQTTTIGSTAGLTISWSGDVCNIYGTYNGLIYVEGSVLIDKNKSFTVKGTLISIGGNIQFNQNATLTINQDSAHMNYVSLACIDTTASDDYTLCPNPLNPNAGNINLEQGNCNLIVNGGAVYCSNIYAKNGAGTNINGVISCMSNNINGFPSGDYTFDPDVYLNPPLGFDLSRFTSKRQIASRTWRELPLYM